MKKVVVPEGNLKRTSPILIVEPSGTLLQDVTDVALLSLTVMVKLLL